MGTAFCIAVLFSAVDLSAASLQRSGDEGAVRFAGGATDAGRLEIHHNGQWGTVCALELHTPATATVACRQLGFGMSTGTFRMPQQAGDEGIVIWLSNVSCSGQEARVADCQHLGWDRVSGACTHKEDLGLRCLACKGSQCDRYRKNIIFYGDSSTSGQLAEALYDGSRKSRRVSCGYGLSGSIFSDPIDCNVQAYVGSSSYSCVPDGPDLVGPDFSTNKFIKLMHPFREHATHNFIYGSELADAYARRRNFMDEYFMNNSGDGDLLLCLLHSGKLQWNDAGIHAKPLYEAFRMNDAAVGVVKSVYLSPRVQLMWDLDFTGGADLVNVTDLAAKKLAETLIKDGVVEIDDFGLDVAALNATIDEAFDNVDSSETSLNGNASMATRVKLAHLQPLIRNNTINEVVRAYLGPDAVLDGYKVVRLLGQTSGNQLISALWHNDRAGNRLKLFVRLHDVSPDPDAGGHPTLVARGSHDLLHYSIEDFKHSRYTDKFVRSAYPIVSLAGKMGGGFIFDTNAIHKGVPEGMLNRTTIVLEYHRSAKCPVIQRLELPIPCPSGDQHLVDEAETLPGMPRNEL